jgi:hypothetical protein
LLETAKQGGNTGRRKKERGGLSRKEGLAKQKRGVY